MVFEVLKKWRDDSDIGSVYYTVCRFNLEADNMYIYETELTSFGHHGYESVTLTTERMHIGHFKGIPFWDPIRGYKGGRYMDKNRYMIYMHVG